VLVRESLALLDQEQRPGGQPAGQPCRDRIRGDIPGSRNVRRGRGHGRWQPDRDLSARKNSIDLLRRPGWRKSLMAVEDDVAELVHGEDRHGMRGGIRKAQALLFVSY